MLFIPSVDFVYLQWLFFERGQVIYTIAKKRGCLLHHGVL